MGIRYERNKSYEGLSMWSEVRYEVMVSSRAMLNWVVCCWNHDTTSPVTLPYPHG